MDTLLNVISKYPNGTGLIVEWQNGCIVSGDIDTIYETNNELDQDDEAYREFHAFLLRITSIVGQTGQKESYCEGDLMEISMQYPPLRVLLKDGLLVWKASEFQ